MKQRINGDTPDIITYTFTVQTSPKRLHQLTDLGLIRLPELFERDGTQYRKSRDYMLPDGSKRIVQYESE